MIWSARALLHVDRIGTYLNEHNPAARVRILNAIARSVRGLIAHPLQGRTGRLARTRELPVPRTAYVVAYSIRDDAIEILAVVHGRQKWPKRL